MSPSDTQERACDVWSHETSGVSSDLHGRHWMTLHHMLARLGIYLKNMEEKSDLEDGPSMEAWVADFHQHQANSQLRTTLQTDFQY